MVNEYKKIVLRIGLEAIKDYEFRLIKSLLAEDLKLTRKMQEDYDRIRIADLMEEKFQNDAGLKKLIELCKDIPALADLAETLEKRKTKVKRKSKGKKKSVLKKGQQDEPTTAHSMSTTNTDNTDSEPESKEEIPLLKENKIKKPEDPERMQLPRKPSQFLKTSATSKHQTKSCPQSPHGPPPTPSSSPPIKRLKIKKSVSLANEQEKISSSLQVGQMPPTAPSSGLQTPQMPPTAPSSSLQTPQMPLTAPSSGLQTPQKPSSGLQIPQMPPTAPSSSLQTPQMPLTAPSGRTHTPYISIILPREIQTPHLPLTSSSRVQTTQMSPVNPSGRIQTPHFSTTHSREIQSPHLSPTSSTKIQTPHVYPISSNSLQTPQMPPTAPSDRTHSPHLSLTSPREIQTPHMSRTKPSDRIQTPHLTSKSSREIQSPHLCPTSSSRIQTPHTYPTSSSSLQTPQTPPTKPSNIIQNPQNSRLTTIPKEASKECGLQKGPKEVMVLKATEPFTYEFKESGKKMFHSTVATESEFFRVKVFDISLKDKFIPKKVIAISDYIGRNGFLEIYSASSVSDVSAARKMEIPYRLVQNANATPKIEYLCSQSTVKYVNGVYTVHKKNVREECTYYEIQDNTGRMEVVVYGRLTYINCEEGDKLNLFCFELAFNADKWQLRSVFHSYIKVIKTRKNKTGPLNPDSNMETS